MDSLNVLLVPMGSSGDVHPFVGIGLAMQARGHRVTMLVNEHFAPLVKRAGFGFVPLGTEEEYLTAINDPDLWHPVRGLKAVARFTAHMTPLVYQFVAERFARGRTVVATGSLAMGARVAQEKLGMPVVTVHLQPAIFRSVHEPPALNGLLALPWMPAWYVRTLYWLVDKLMIDPAYGKGINDFRKEVGLPPVERIMKDWIHSPERVIGLFPEWFAAKQPDWPKQTVLTGFPLYDESSAQEALAPDVASFLDGGDAPIVFTPGSANRHAAAFFAAAVGACQKLGRRGMLLTKFREQVPRNLPDNVRHFAYVPLSQVLPRSAALVYHGGIGTCAQAFKAGVPHLIMPLSHDQPDNAMRVRRLGVGDALYPARFTAERVAAKLERLLGSAEVKARCGEIARRLVGDDAVDRTCAVLEAAAANG